MDASEHDLLRKAVEGDGDAVAELIKRHAGDVERSISIDRAWQSQLDVADVMQVTAIEVFEHIRNFDLGRADQFPAWLRHMAHNNLRDAIRGLSSRKRGGGARTARCDNPSDLSNLIPVTSNDPGRDARRGERAALLNQALDKLPTDYARTIRMLDFEGKSVAQAASELNRTVGAVHMLRARAYDRLRRLLGPPSRLLTWT